MNIFSDLNLKGNEVQEAILKKGKIANGYGDITGEQAGAGAIKFDLSTNTLQYSDGSIWQTVGNETPQINNVSGSFGIYTTSSFAPGDTAKVRVMADANGTGSLTSTYSMKVTGDEKGKLTLAGKDTYVVKVIYCNIDIASEINTVTSFAIPYDFGTSNLLVNTYFSSKKAANSEYTFFQLIQCDVTIETSTTGQGAAVVEHDKVTVSVNHLPAGILKVVVYGGAETGVTQDIEFQTSDIDINSTTLPDIAYTNKTATPSEKSQS